MLKILVAPTAFKGTLSPVKVAQAIGMGIEDAGLDSEAMLYPLADGGDGTLECLHFSLGGNFEFVSVKDALDEIHSASWLCLPNMAVVELAGVCGLALLSGRQLEPLRANTYGLGQVLKDCIEKGESNIIVALGGSASTDGGVGALMALGARFLDSGGKEIAMGGGGLSSLVSIDLTPLLKLTSGRKIQIAVDVTNPLLGSNGAACIFALQKGASNEEIQLLDAGLKHLADLLEKASNKTVRNIPGSGAAGGTAFGLVAALNAELISGFNWMSNLLKLDDQIAHADLVITAEGKLDSQSLQGKAVGELAQKCKVLGKTLWVITGSVEENLKWQERGISKVIEPGKVVTQGSIRTSVANLLVELAARSNK